MGFFDRSKSETNLTEYNEQTIVTENKSLSDIEGFGLTDIGGDVEISIDQVDSGVVAAAENLGAGALALSGDIAAQSLRASGDAFSRAAALGERSITTVSGIAGDSIEAQNRTVEYAIGQQRATLQSALDFGRNLTDKTVATLSSAVGAAADATRTDSSQVLNNITKYGALVIAALAGVYLLSRMRA